MSSNPIEIEATDTTRSMKEPDRRRRMLVRGAAAAAPAIMTLRSGAALAQVSTFATPYQAGLAPSGQCAGWAQPDVVEKFPVDPDSVWPAAETAANGECPTGYSVGYDLDPAVPPYKNDVCCQTNTVLVTASSASSLATSLYYGDSAV